MTSNADNKEFLELKRTLQAFQQERLREMYADIKSDPQYKQIGIFFFDKLYAPEDFTFRDTSIKKLHRLLNGKIYSGIISAINKVIELHELSDMLDDQVVEQMIALGIGTDMNMTQYQEAYRRLDNYDERIHQIELGAEVIRIFHRLSKKWIVAVSLNTVRTAAHLIGMGKILDFIHEGYAGFRAIRDISYFAETVSERETAWHNEIWSKKGECPSECLSNDSVSK